MKKENIFIFIGNFFHKPNVDAVLTLKNKIWNEIRGFLPKAEVHIYGAYLNQQIKELHNPKEGFIIKGFVENAQEVREKCKDSFSTFTFWSRNKRKTY